MAFFVWALLAYLVVVNGVYLLLNLLAVRTVREKVTLRQLENLPPVQATLVPPVSVIVAARDDEDGVVDRVRAALALDYPRFEVLVVNDGSRDATLDRLREAFALEAFPEVYWRRITVKPVRTIYHSRLHRNLRVVDKERGGTADAINAAVNTSRYPLFIHLDPRWTLRRGGLGILAEPFVDDPDTVAVCSTVRIDPDGSGALETGPSELPPRMFSRLQIVEHLREPLFGRLGWARLNAALVVSGSAILFRKDTVGEAAGFRGDMLVEEMELVTRLHKLWRARDERYVVGVVPEPICWARPAASLGELRGERMRWQLGLQSRTLPRAPWRRGALAGLPVPVVARAILARVRGAGARPHRRDVRAGPRPRHGRDRLPRARFRAGLPGVDERAGARGRLLPHVSALGPVRAARHRRRGGEPGLPAAGRVLAPRRPPALVAGAIAPRAARVPGAVSRGWAKFR